MPLTEPPMETRMIYALRRTYQVIGVDLWPDGATPSKRTLREIIPDGDSLENYGDDKEAVAEFRAFDFKSKVRASILARAFP